MSDRSGTGETRQGSSTLHASAYLACNTRLPVLLTAELSRRLPAFVSLRQVLANNSIKFASLYNLHGEVVVMPERDLNDSSTTTSSYSIIMVS